MHGDSIDRGRVPDGLAVTWLVVAGSRTNPMGLQRYETELAHTMSGVGTAPFRLTTRHVGGLRASSGCDARIPLRRLQRASTTEARAWGRLVCRGLERVHRFDLRLPPAPGGGVITVHDLPPLRFADEGHLAAWSIKTTADAQLIICPSEFAANEAEDLLRPREIMIIPNGVDLELFQGAPMSSAELAGLGIPERYVLHAGGATTRKNLPALAEAWRMIQPSLPEHALILVGPADRRRDAAFAGLGRVRMLGWQTPATVARLMCSATVVVVPSRYEGFGLPALEGMAAGAPVVAANAGALPEVCGDAAVLTGTDARSIADGIYTACTDYALSSTLRLRGHLRAREFTWARSAGAHLAAYQKAFLV
jgi:glycosyltransferase involved in cell wall biosynthesis